MYIWSYYSKYKVKIFKKKNVRSSLGYTIIDRSRSKTLHSTLLIRKNLNASCLLFSFIDLSVFTQIKINSFYHLVWPYKFCPYMSSQEQVHQQMENKPHFWHFMARYNVKAPILWFKIKHKFNCRCLPPLRFPFDMTGHNFPINQVFTERYYFDVFYPCNYQHSYMLWPVMLKMRSDTSTNRHRLSSTQTYIACWW